MEGQGVIEMLVAMTPPTGNGKGPILPKDLNIPAKVVGKVMHFPCKVHK